MIPISFRDQMLPGTFEHTLSYLIDHELICRSSINAMTTVIPVLGPMSPRCY